MEYKISKYLEMLEEENKKQNLVSRKSLAEEICKHVQDSLRQSVHRHIRPEFGRYWQRSRVPRLILSISRPIAK